MATNKSDVYAFGVVLFEMISGKEAITRTEGVAAKSADRRSLASIVSSGVSVNQFSNKSVLEMINSSRWVI